jgi:pyruvate dehydrogenase E2 component (dihydrolipoamide acetyltransferase)
MRTSAIEAAGSRIRVIEDGEGERTVLFVHGVGGWAENWGEAMARVAASGRRAIAFDLPGFGESTPVRGARYFDLDAPFYASVVDGVRRALGLVRPHLVGHSLGTGVAFVSAVTHPNSIRSLVLAAPGGLGSDIAPFLRLWSLPGLDLLMRLRRPRFIRHAVLRSCFADPARIPAHLFTELDRYDGTDPETMRVMRQVATLRGVRDELRLSWMARAGRFTGPVLVIWGSADIVISPSQADALGSVFTDHELAVIPDAGHLVMAEQPDAFADALLPFLDRAEREDTGARTMALGVAYHER